MWYFHVCFVFLFVKASLSADKPWKQKQNKKANDFLIRSCESASSAADCQAQPSGGSDLILLHFQGACCTACLLLTPPCSLGVGGTDIVGSLCQVKSTHTLTESTFLVSLCEAQSILFFFFADHVKKHAFTYTSPSKTYLLFGHVINPQRCHFETSTNFRYISVPEAVFSLLVCSWVEFSDENSRFNFLYTWSQHTDELWLGGLTEPAKSRVSTLRNTCNACISILPDIVIVSSF